MICFSFCLKDNSSIVVEQPGMLGSGRRTPQFTPSAESALSKTGTVARSLSSPGEKTPKSTWEVSESIPNSKSRVICGYLCCFWPIIFL